MTGYYEILENVSDGFGNSVAPRRVGRARRAPNVEDAAAIFLAASRYARIRRKLLGRYRLTTWHYRGLRPRRSADRNRSLGDPIFARQQNFLRPAGHTTAGRARPFNPVVPDSTLGADRRYQQPPSQIYGALYTFIVYNWVFWHGLYRGKYLLTNKLVTKQKKKWFKFNLINIREIRFYKLIHPFINCYLSRKYTRCGY